jgi:NADP-dependent 3-hydroxy acid dehydrogenase YdfG
MVYNKRGHIINIGSIAGKEVYPKGNIYCASKFAVDAISQGMRIDLNHKNIKVSQVNPGLVNTEFSKVRFKNDKEKTDNVYKGMVPLIADDIAEVINFIINRSDNVNISDITILPKAQASSTVVKRD